MFDYAVDAVESARIDLWAGEPPPLIICESRAVKGVLERLAGEYLVPITATAGQCGGFLVNEVAPLLEDGSWERRVGYIGDHEIRGPADQIEANTRARTRTPRRARVRRQHLGAHRAHPGAGQS